MTLTSTSSLEETLNAYIADEYFSSLQYRMAKVVAKGKALEYSNNLFGDNGDEEDEHFDEIVEYAQSLNIAVQVNPEEMKTNCTTPFVELHDGDTTAQLVSILIASEKKAIEGYEIGLRNDGIVSDHPELIQFLGEKLNDERGHLKELEDLKSNIEASGKTVPQADNVNEPDKSDTSVMNNDDKKNDDIDDTDNTKDEGGDDDEEDDTNESIVSDLTRKISLGNISASDVVKNMLCYIEESTISDFADYKSYFNSDLARETSQYNANQCKNKFMELVDDGMIDENVLMEDLINYVGIDEVAEFAKDLGYVSINESSSDSLKCDVREIKESNLSFSKLFKQIAD